MVRINLIQPEQLMDQHLIAEYNEILMLLGYVRKYPAAESIPEEYTLGKGHIKFFKNKLLYLQKRHEKIKSEMQKRRFKTDKAINLSKFDSKLINDWKPKVRDFEIIRERLKQKLDLKPNNYRFFGKRKEL